MSKYQNGKIYKIVDIGYNKCYIGSTTENLSQRMARHRSQSKKRNGNHFRVCSFDVFDEYGVENCKIELIENFSCNTKEELMRREGEYIKNLNCVNKIIAGRTKKEHYEDNKEHILEHNRLYKELHKEEKRELNKTYYKNNIEQIKSTQNKVIDCECGVAYTKRNKARHEKTKHHQTYLNTNI